MTNLFERIIKIYIWIDSITKMVYLDQKYNEKVYLDRKYNDGYT